MIYITYFSLTLAIITMVGSCVAYKCTNRQNNFLKFHFTPFHTMIRNYYKNGFIVSDGRIGFQKDTA